MNEFENQASKNGFSMKLWRGERMCLLGFDVENPEDDFVGFAIECKAPGEKQFTPLLNRLAFSYDTNVSKAVDGFRNFPSTEAPFQKFRWLHFPKDHTSGSYTYRATKMHMPADNQLVKGESIELGISLDPVTYHDFLDIGFTRNFASSQAFLEKFPNQKDIKDIGGKIIPNNADDGLKFKKMDGDIYQWMGFEAYDLIFNFLDESLKDEGIELDVFAFDLNEPDIVSRLEKFGKRLRIIIDDSVKTKNGKKTGHGASTSAESQSAKRFVASSGKENVKRTHFKSLQHNKVFIAKKDGKPVKVLMGSANFSFRGIYIQANNVVVFTAPEIAQFFSESFNNTFKDPSTFNAQDLASKWHLFTAEGKPPVHLCFSPHKSSDLSLNPLRGAIDQANSSVFYSVAFLAKIASGPTKEAFDRLIKRPIFSYGITDSAGTLSLKKPDGSLGLVDFAYLSKCVPEPFKSEWSGGKGINIHHKFVVVDFNLPTAKVFTGSSNLSPSGETGNGDNLIMIEDKKIATSYALEALRVFDHLQFRCLMQTSNKKNEKKKLAALSLRKPEKISGEKPWFTDYYVAKSQKENDRKLFSK